MYQVEVPQINTPTTEVDAGWWSNSVFDSHAGDSNLCHVTNLQFTVSYHVEITGYILFTDPADSLTKPCNCPRCQGSMSERKVKGKKRKGDAETETPNESNRISTDTNAYLSDLTLTSDEELPVQQTPTETKKRRITKRRRRTTPEILTFPKYKSKLTALKKMSLCTDVWLHLIQPKNICPFDNFSEIVFWPRNSVICCLVYANCTLF